MFLNSNYIRKKMIMSEITSLEEASYILSTGGVTIVTVEQLVDVLLQKALDFNVYPKYDDHINLKERLSEPLLDADVDGFNCEDCEDFDIDEVNDLLEQINIIVPLLK